MGLIAYELPTLPEHMRFYVGEMATGYAPQEVGPIFPIYNADSVTNESVFYLVYKDGLGREFVSATKFEKGRDFEGVVRGAVKEFQERLTETS